MNIRTVTCYGTGTIGCGWAVNFAWKEIAVTMYNPSDDELETAKRRVAEMLGHLLENDVIGGVQMAACQARITFTTDREAALTGADLIQESVPENLALKRTVLREIEELCPPEAVISTSTSSLLVADIAQDAKHPGRIVGGHPFTPVYLIPLVEVIRGANSDPCYVRGLVDFYRKVGKEPIVLEKEIPGFVSNRLQAALMREARDLVCQGVCSIEDVDKAVTFGPGLRWAIMGPNLITALNGGPANFFSPDRLRRVPSKDILGTLAAWTETPEPFVERCRPGIEQAMANRAPGTGRTYEELRDYRDEGLLTLLRYHKKL